MSPPASFPPVRRKRKYSAYPFVNEFTPEKTLHELCDKAFDEWEQDRMVKSATKSPRCGFSDIKNIVVMTTAAIAENQYMQKSDVMSL
ncbi:hypothetical protein F2Q70_00015648 [Brassica cretica]|uniref:Uncharacterized protein n=1 Tax=Brassica cretica TaxID=69181 RepID=A0A8S9HZT7_BRACR|nr:hypothetical protein F2Q70_00015648 [Brassica cretica]